MDRSKMSAVAVAGFPDDLLVEILSRVPAKSVCRFRCVCKAWRGLIDDPLNRRKLPQTLEGFFRAQQPRVSGGNVVVGHFDFVNFLARSVPLDIDSCFSFMTTRPEIECLFFQDLCNGLFLFEHCRKSQSLDTLGYIVCNPATKQWGAVPPCGCCLLSTCHLDKRTFLAFDPAVSSHFHLIQFCRPPGENTLMMVLSYSSETGMWSHNQTDSDEQRQLEGWRHQGILSFRNAITKRAFVNGSLHLIVLDLFEVKMVAVDVQGKTKRMITMARSWHVIPCIAVSQGRLHYINHDLDAQRSGFELYVWVLQDYDTQEWVLKDTVSFLKLFGTMTAGRQRDFEVVAIHPDRNVVFFRQPLNRLIAYDMDRKEVSGVAGIGNGSRFHIAPYIPYFSESPVLKNKH